VNKLREFLDADVTPLSLQVKLFEAQHRTRLESHQPILSTSTLAVRPKHMITVEKPNESVWFLAHKIVAFTQNYVQQAGWNRGGILQWLFIHEPWWTLEPGDQERYAKLFPKLEWLKACGILATARSKMLQKETQNFTTEDRALLKFLADSHHFVEQIYMQDMSEST